MATNWLSRAAVLAMHERLLADHGGSPGLRDPGLLDSALARARNLQTYGTPDTCDMAAAYAVGIIRNHPFVDGNKRTGFMAAYVFLAENGRQLRAPEVEVVQTVTLLAARQIDEAEFAAWLREHGEPT
ncbi:MAG: type II toxin-antitoxin system death-on-curing family toxin [Gammaproteobacteria bacterium]|nr:type II toxin-antitoxin system death-on-curing family toxin [Gammaproteobacteria bacterium]